MKRFALPLVIAIVAGCGGDSTGPERPSLTDVWVYNAANLAGSGVSCQITNVSLNIDQFGDTFTGTAVGGRVYCLYQGTTFADEARNTQVVGSGLYTGNSVSFDIGSPGWLTQEV